MPNTQAGGGRAVHGCVPQRPASIPRSTCCATSCKQQYSVVAWVEDEGLLDPVTAVSGSGPAYVFLLGVGGDEQGIPADLARLLARQTVAGSGALLAASAEDAAELRRAVGRPAGPRSGTAGCMAADAWPAALSRAIAAATEAFARTGGVKPQLDQRTKARAIG